MEGMTAAVRPRAMAFASGTYMLRSEKRRHYEPPKPEAQPPKEPKKDKPPKKKKEPKAPRVKRTEAGFIYKFFTVFFGILIWPIGMILLLRKYLRWKPFTKLIAGILLLACMVFLYGFLLTLNTGNEEYTRIQDTVNAYIEKAYAKAEIYAEHAADKLVEIRDGADNLLRACVDRGSIYLADMIDAGVDLSWQAREKIGEWTGNDEVMRPTATPQPTPVPTPKPTQPPETPRPYDGHVTVDASTIVLPVYVPTGPSDSARGNYIVDGIMTHRGLSPLAEEVQGGGDAGIVRSYTVRSAASVIVYCNIGSGQYYHSKSSCGSMKIAQEHTLPEAVAAGMKACERCNPIPAELLDIEQIVWKDGNDLLHTTDGCPAFSGSWTVMTAADAAAKGYSACAECDCDDYIEAVKRGDEMNVVPLEQFS